MLAPLNNYTKGYKNQSTAKNVSAKIKEDSLIHKQFKKKHQEKSSHSLKKPVAPYKLFNSGKKDLEGQYKLEKMKSSNNIITTDESNNLHEDDKYSSPQFVKNSTPNEEYFEPLAFKSVKSKDKKRKKQQILQKNTADRGSLIDSINLKLREIKSLVKLHERQIQSKSPALSEKEFKRLIKIQSIEKLKLVETVKTIQRKIESKEKHLRN